MRASAIAPLLLAVLLAGCATVAPRQTTSPYRVTATGDIVWEGEYQFSPPPKEWRLIPLDETDTSFAYLKLTGGEASCQSTFAYSEEPFGSSRDLHQRMREFYKRFLWASRVTFDSPKSRRVTIFGREGLEATAVGRDPVRGQKVWTQVIFARRGERIVAFFMTQWRPMGEKFDPTEKQIFQHFVHSFRFLRPSFYQTL
jgi:hypothetical protein